jgi:hypothetical protein
MSNWFAPLSLAHRHQHHHHEHTDSDFETVEESDHMSRIKRKKSAALHHVSTLAFCAISALMMLPFALYYISGKAVSFEMTKQSPRSNIRVRNQWISSEAQAFVSLLLYTRLPRFHPENLKL